METYTLEKDITIFYVTATSFPDGIAAAHQRLHNLLPSGGGRNFIAVSRPENNGAIVYKTGVEELVDGEGKKLGCDTLIIEKGKYISSYIVDHTSDPLSINNIFSKLLQTSNLDPNGYCVEMYFGQKGVRCMVRLKD